MFGLPPSQGRLGGLIWNALDDRVNLFVDGRMAAEVVRVLSVADSCGRAHYSGTLFSESQAFPQACTARSTIYSANVAAGLMVCAFTKWLRGMPVERDVTFNVLGTELLVNV